MGTLIHRINCTERPAKGSLTSIGDKQFTIAVFEVQKDTDRRHEILINEFIFMDC